MKRSIKTTMAAMILCASAATLASCSTSPEEDGKRLAELMIKHDEAVENYGRLSKEEQAALKEWNEFRAEMQEKYKDDDEGTDKVDAAYRQTKANYRKSKRAAE